jgi:hypothetical protein
VMTLEGGRKVVDLECHMWRRLDQVRIRRAVPVPLPLNTERIIQMIADKSSSGGLNAVASPHPLLPHRTRTWSGGSNKR